MKFKLVLLVGVVAVLSLALALPAMWPGTPKEVVAMAEDADAITKDTEATAESIAFEPWPEASSAVPTRSLEEAAYLLGALVERSPKAYTGVYLDSGAGRVVVTLPDGADVEGREAAILREFAKRKLAKEVDVHFSRVKYSLADMTKVQAALTKLLASDWHEDELVGVGSDPTRGAAVVMATEDSEAMRAELNATYGDKIIFRQTGRPTLHLGGQSETAVDSH